MRSVAQRLAYAAAQVKHPSRDWLHDCQMFVRTACDVPARDGTALIAWNHASEKHHSDRHPPAGVPCYYDDPRRSGEAGHAVLSDGNGGIYTTDKPTHRIGHVSLGWPEANWGLRYLGWTPFVNGVRVYRAPAIVVPKPSTPRTVDLSNLLHDIETSRPRSSNVAAVQKALGVTATGLWGDKTRAAYAMWQRAQGYSGSNADGIPGISSLAKLGTRGGFAVRL